MSLQHTHCVYVHNECDITFPSACPRGSYGKSCLKECQCGGSTCEPETGDCVCQAGKMGRTCDEGKLYMAYLSILSYNK